jgi:branched-chain amino acid aminotransferase
MRIWVGTRDGGALAHEDRATVSVLDHAFTVGDGVFETLRVTSAGPFALTRHLRRLHTSASLMGMPVPNDDVIRDAVRQVLDANQSGLGTLGRLRITYTGGVGPLGSNRGSSVPTLVVAAAPAVPWPVTTSIITVPWTRNEHSPLAGVKSTSYAENVIALQFAHGSGASEAIFGNTSGVLCEGTGTNVFVVVDGRVLTPSLASGCLPGITRELVLEWLGAEEAELPLGVLTNADEVFLTSSTRNIHPVVRCGDRIWPSAGPISVAMAADFDRRSDSAIDP